MVSSRRAGRHILRLCRLCKQVGCFEGLSPLYHGSNVPMYIVCLKFLRDPSAPRRTSDRVSRCWRALAKPVATRAASVLARSLQGRGSSNAAVSTDAPAACVNAVVYFPRLRLCNHQWYSHTIKMHTPKQSRSILSHNQGAYSHSNQVTYSHSNQVTILHGH